MIQDLKDRQEELQQLQLSNPDAFTVEQKTEFDLNAEELKKAETRLAVVEEALKQNTNNAATGSQSGEDSQLVKLKIAFGNRFSSKTGKEINSPQPVSFTYGEWQLFKESYCRLGYEITEIINDPYGDAAALVAVPKD